MSYINNSDAIWVYMAHNHIFDIIYKTRLKYIFNNNKRFEHVKRIMNHDQRIEAIKYYAKHNNIEAVKFLLNMKNRYLNNRNLHYSIYEHAIMSGNMEMVDLIIPKDLQSRYIADFYRYGYADVVKNVDVLSGHLVFRLQKTEDFDKFYDDDDFLLIDKWAMKTHNEVLLQKIGYYQYKKELKTCMNNAFRTIYALKYNNYKALYFLLRYTRNFNGIDYAEKRFLVRKAAKYNKLKILRLIFKSGYIHEKKKDIIKILKAHNTYKTNRFIKKWLM